MSVYDLGKNREVCWDFELADKIDNIELKMHPLQKKNVAFITDREWEGRTSGYPGVMKVDGKYRFYYRGSGAKGHKCGEVYCVAESDDGKTFTKPNLGLYEYNGRKDNNIMFSDERFVDNFCVYKDENPDCPPDEKFKGLSLYFVENPPQTDLWYYKSSDGYKFEFVRALPIKGVFDSRNTLFWDKEANEYKMYVRNFHDKDGNQIDWEPTKKMEKAIRDVRLTTSKDFINWTETKEIEYVDAMDDIQMYTNQIEKYHRANIYIGMPTRYSDRRADAHNYKYLPKWGGRRQPLIDKMDRGGFAVQDCTIMTSRDGFHFNRSENAYMVPDIEREYNWCYSECYYSYGIVETEIDDYPGQYELSMYIGERYEYDYLRVIRCTVRLDGFYSWRGNRKGGTIISKPVKFDGEQLKINFKTSALGYLRIKICDEDVNLIEGYDSKKLFGNSLERPVDFDKPLSEIAGKTVRLQFELSDADLYSFIFE